jgi:hypothetical protein
VLYEDGKIKLIRQKKRVMANQKQKKIDVQNKAEKQQQQTLQHVDFIANT